jgi:hypothetical protein
VSCVGSSRNHEWMTWATSHCRRETGVGSDGPRSSMWVKSWSESSALIASAAPQKRSAALQRTYALCHEETHALQQNCQSITRVALASMIGGI